MHDFDFDVKEKKKLVQSARRRVCGSRSKKCTLPSDHLTPAQWKKKNGSIVTMNLNIPLMWEEFKALPVDLQKEYIMRCIARFNCNMSSFAELFGVHFTSIKRKFINLGIDMSLFQAGKKMTKEQKTEFENWLSPTSPEIKTQDATEEKEKELKHADISHTYPPDFPSTTDIAFDRLTFPLEGMDRFDMEYIGDLNFAQIMMALYQFANHSPVKLKISVEKVKPDV